MEISTLYQLFTQCSGVTTDSRNCPADSLFFALKGANFNGNAYARSALEKGCKYAIVDEAEYADGERIFLVENTLSALQMLANHHRKQLKAKVIGITGTNGKTTTKELVASVLAKKYRTAYTQGNLNNHIGVPLTLLRLTDADEMAVVEMGANHVGEIAELANIAEPDFGIITNVGRAHLEGFGSFENIIATKTELYRFIASRVGGKLFVDADNGILTEASLNIPRVLYGTQADCYVWGEIAENNPFISVRWQFGGKTYKADTQLIGSYNFANILAAITIGTYMGVDAESINAALKNYTPTNNRSQLTRTQYNTLIIDAYNANPTSMSAALKNFGELAAERKAVILGDMLELGSESATEHTKIVEWLTEAEFDTVFLVGKEFMANNQHHTSFPTVDGLIDHLRNHELKGYTILVKGSRGIRLEQVAEVL